MNNLRMLFGVFLLFVSYSLPAQQTISGTVTDKTTGDPLPGAGIQIKNASVGTIADLDGSFTIDGVNPTDILVFSFIGMQPQERLVSSTTDWNIMLAEDSESLEEVVVIGYGSVKKEDATGSVTGISSKDFNKTPVVGAEQLLQGKVPGVKITTSGGQPDAAPNIRIRGGSSLSANNNPLIVIDGVPIDNTNPAGVSNPLTLVNPNDVESFSILKDASATAIYGSRASNGVIIITTKKGVSGKPQFNFSSNVSLGKVSDELEIMDGTQFTRFMQEYHSDYTNLLGVNNPDSDMVDDPTTPEVEGRTLTNTDWQDAIFRTSVSLNNNLSMRGSLFDNKVPLRLSVGHTKSEGLVKTNDYERYSVSARISPELVNDRLKLDINAKGIFVDKNAIDEGGVLGGVINMDPTKPIYDSASPFGGYFQTMDPVNGLKTDGQYNPIALLEQRERPEKVNKFLGNVELDYRLGFIPDLKAVVNAGLETSNATIEEVYGENALATYQLFNNGTEYVFNPGVNYKEDQDITNTTLDGYLVYTKYLDGKTVSKVDMQAGYSYQNFENDGTKDIYQYNIDTGLREEVINDLNPTNRYFSQLNLQSFFGRANIDVLDKYLVTLSLRADGSSLFRKDDRWGYFPAAAVAWKVTDEDFLKDSEVIDNLKLRLGWGQTGQQDITGAVGFYPSTPLFAPGSATSQYLSGVNVYSAIAYNDNLTWEKASTYNAGVDYEILDNLIDGSFDVFTRTTTDLLARVPVAPGQGLTSSFVKNVGETSSDGFEWVVNVRPISTENSYMKLSYNLAYNKTKVDDLKDVDVIPSAGGGLPVGTGVNLAYNQVGYQPHSAWVFKQLYNTDGTPIWGAFADLNGDNVIDNNDRFYKALRPNWTYGFALNHSYKNWDLSTSLRGQIGGQVYNSRKLTSGWLDRPIPQNSNSLSNVLNFYDSDVADPNFINYNGNVQFSDYYLEDASFLRWENIVLGYQFDKFVKDSSLRLYGSVANPFLFTDYTGQDPENFNGIDTNFYPRPTTYTFGLNLDF